jgi:hypothetical protein
MTLVHSLDLRGLASLCKNLTDYLQKKVYRLLYGPSVAHEATGFWRSIAYKAFCLIFWMGKVFYFLKFVLQTDIGRIGLQRQIG